MSTKVTALFVGLFASLAIAAGTLQGCGSSGGNSNVATCEKVCDKVLACTPDAGSIGQQAAMQCKANCPNQVAMCSNASAIAGAINTCLAMDCAGAINCIQTIPACQSTSGAGGSTGTGGTTGTGGGGGSNGANCATCTKVDACCVALGGTTAQCNSVASCLTATADQAATINAACQTALTQLAMQPNAPAACQ